LTPRLCALFGVDTEVAGQLLTTAGDNPDRLHSEAALAHLCGAAPIPRQFRPQRPPPPQPRRRPRRQPRSLHHRPLPHALRPPNQGLRRPTRKTRTHQKRDHSIAGHHSLLSWTREYGDARRAGVEETGAYGTALARFLRTEGVIVTEVNRPNRAKRRRWARATRSTPKPPLRPSSTRRHAKGWDRADQADPGIKNRE